MANANFTTADGIAGLTERLRELEASGLPKPVSCLLSDYLRFLVDHELLSADAAGNVESIYYQSRYGHADISADLLAGTLAHLDDSLTRLRELEPPQRESLAVKLQNAHAAELQQERGFKRPNPFSTAEELTLPSLIPEFPGFSDASEQTLLPSDPTSSRRVRGRQLAIGVLWTALAVTAGYFGHDKVSSLFGQKPPIRVPAINFHQVRNRYRGQLSDRRNAVLAAETDEDRAQMMRDLALMHSRRREFADYYVILEQLVERYPDNAHDKHSLASFLLTSTDPWYRNPVRARQFAGEAVAIDPQPFYLDTLAEAVYQTGDPQRAVEIEQQALASELDISQHWKNLFEDHLKKFQKAASEKSASTNVGVTVIRNK